MIQKKKIAPDISVYGSNNENVKDIYDIESISEYLEKVGDEIKLITGNSEQQFLEIGGKLQLFLTSSRELTETSSQAAASISGSILQNGINEINWLIKQFSERLNASAKDIKNDKEELLRVNSDVVSILQGLDGFRKIVKHLRMLGISTKIESARLGDDDKGFNTLAEHVEKLSNMINEKATVIASKATFLSSEINKTTKDLEVLERDQNSQSEVILNNTSLTLGQFEKKYYDCSERVENIANNSKNVSKNIGNIVTSIQFHDITRQQMEHVYEALEEVSGKINLSGFRGSVKEVPEDNLSTLHDVCELQSYQFSSSINEFVEAVDNIILHLKDVEHNVTDIFSDTLCLLAEDDSSGDNSRKDNSLSAVKTELSAILSSLHKNEEISEELSKSIKSVVEIVEDLAKYVLEIEEIGTEIEIIALNARIKAAHTGLNGLALGVLAEEIQKLSIDAKAQTISVTGILQDIGKISKTLKMSIDESAQKEDSNSVSDINEKIIGLINTIIDLEKDTKVTIDGIRTKVTNLKDDINKTADNIKIHHQNKQIADGINALLMAIISVLKKNINPAVNKKSNVDNLLAKYTMDSERQIHERFSKKEKLAIENNDDESEKKQDDFFGDNVDLF